MRSLLQAPPGLRQYLLHCMRCPPLNHISRSGTRRTVSNGIKVARRSQANPRASNDAPPLRRYPQADQPKGSASYIDTLLGGSDKVLLYLSPNHGTLYTSSYMIGGAFLFGAFSWAQFALKEAPDSDGQPGGQTKAWYVRLGLSAEVLVVVVLGTHFLLTPSKLIKSIALVKSATSVSAVSSVEPILRLEIKRGLPMLKPDVLEIAPSDIFREARLVSSDPMVQRFAVPLANAQEFTSQYDSGKLKPPVLRQSLMRSLWPAVKRDTRRMFMRDQMAYLRTSTNGRFKLDLQGAMLLDGDALFHLIAADRERRLGLVGYLRGLLSG